MKRPRSLLLTALAAVSISATACGPRQEEKGVDPTTKDGGLADKPGPADTAPSGASAVLPSGTPVQATPMQAQLDAYLKSGQTAERAFQFDSLRFTTGGELRQDPNYSLTTLAALLNAYPQTRVQIRAYAAPGEPASAGADRAAKVAQALVGAGVDASRVTSAGAVAARAGEDRVDLVVAPAAAAAAPPAKS